MQFKQPLRVIVRKRHYVVVSGNGQTLLTSETYANHDVAKRAAKRFIEAVCTVPITLEYFDMSRRSDPKYVRVTAAKPSAA